MRHRSLASHATRAGSIGVVLFWLVAMAVDVASAQTLPGVDADDPARHEADPAYRLARKQARSWLDALVVDPVELNQRGMKGQKKLAEIMDIYLFLWRTSGPQERARIERRVHQLALHTERSDYHNMQVCTDRVFKQNSMSYMRVMWLMREFGLDTTHYERELMETRPRMDAHLSSRGAWQQAMFARYYERFGMEKPRALRRASNPRGLLKRRTALEDYDRKRSYQLTHEVFVAFDYGYAKDQSRFDKGDIDYLRVTLPALLSGALERHDADLASELTSAMVSLGWGADATVQQAITYLLSSQNKNGSWGRYEAARPRYGDFVEQNFYLHTTGAALRALVAYFD